jgi:hypothetical protein
VASLHAVEPVTKYVTCSQCPTNALSRTTPGVVMASIYCGPLGSAPQSHSDLPPKGMIELDPVVRTRLCKLPWLPFSYKHTLTLTVRHLLDRVQEQFPVVGVHLCKKPSHLLKIACVFTANSPCL